MSSHQTAKNNPYFHLQQDIFKKLFFKKQQREKTCTSIVVLLNF